MKCYLHLVSDSGPSSGREQLNTSIAGMIVMSLDQSSLAEFYQLPTSITSKR